MTAIYFKPSREKVDKNWSTYSLTFVRGQSQVINSAERFVDYREIWPLILRDQMN